MYSVFVRNWWRKNSQWPNGLEPCPGKKKYLDRHVPTIEAAREMCAEYNRTHKPGPLSRKAEFEKN